MATARLEFELPAGVNIYAVDYWSGVNITHAGGLVSLEGDQLRGVINALEQCADFLGV